MYGTRELPLHRVHSARAWSTKHRISRRHTRWSQNWCRACIVVVLIISAILIFGQVRPLVLVIASAQLQCCCRPSVESELRQQSVFLQGRTRKPSAGRHHSSGNPVARRGSLGSLQNLVLVACHAVFTGHDYTRHQDFGSWFLLDYQKVGLQIKLRCRELLWCRFRQHLACWKLCAGPTPATAVASTVRRCRARRSPSCSTCSWA